MENAVEIQGCVLDAFECTFGKFCQGDCDALV